jgi:NhaP-type Na+/H+ or K+/H+ antiporter
MTIALGVFALYALVAGRLDRWSITAPIVLVAAGIVLGEGGLQVLHVTAGAESVKLLAELTLAVLLFADASTVRLRDGGGAGLPGRLLGFGLPLTIGLGTLAAHYILSVSWAESALIASILAPTDAALGLAVVTNTMVPAKIRRALNIESGLNDGVATPFVVFFLAVVAAEAEHQHWILGGLKEIALAVVFGAAIGALSGWTATRARQAGWTTPLSDALFILSVSLLSYEGAVMIHGNGFVSAFIAGALFGATAHHRFHQATELTEDVGLYASFAVWLIFGAVFAGPVLRDGWHWRPILYAALSLTLVRMAPVAAALIGTRLRLDTVAFVGWFGPRGLASVVFTLLVYEEFHGASPANGVAEVATWTILLSVLAHGLSAGPLASGYARRLAGSPPGIPELEDTPEPRARRRSLHDRGRIPDPTAGKQGA